MFIKRAMSERIKAGAKESPVIAIIGPRQSGKSTIAKELFKDHLYLDMQDADLFEFANRDPKGFLNQHQTEHGIIIDEAQYAPKLFSQIKVEVDKNRRPGYYILTGSQNFLLHEKISESLAGRVYFYSLLPLSIKELSQAKLQEPTALDQIAQGFYPHVYQPHINREEYYQNYISTYVERDIRTIRNIDQILIFKRFMQLCALRIGNTVNITELASECNIGTGTAKSWLALLETSFILFQLPPYYNNLGKRITKSPKLYFYDVGLAFSLLHVDKASLSKQRALYGALFENMSIIDIMKNLNAEGVHHNLTFYRDTNQNEVDLIIEAAGKVIPIEIKASETIQHSFFETALWFQKETKSEKPVIIYGGDQTGEGTDASTLSWHNLDQLVKKTK